MTKGFKIQDILLYPFSIVYGIIVWSRNQLFNYKILSSKEFTLPVISVGNITVGGTGKTPHVEYVVKLLKDEFKVATLSRGYKRKTKGFFLADLNSKAEEIGDEPRQIKQKFPSVAVAVDANRVNGIQKLTLLERGLNAVILDDAFQHRYVTPGLSILLVDYNRPLGSDHLLPLGCLREMPSERVRADIIIVTKCPKTLKPIEQRLLDKELKMYAYQKVYFSTLQYEEPLPVFENFAKPLTFDKINSNYSMIYMLTGIANPTLLKQHINQYCKNVIELTYPDHYQYTAKDLHLLIEKFSVNNGTTKAIITTEKDAMRLQQFSDLDEEIKAAMYYVPIEVEFLENEGKIFNQQIIGYVRNNKPDNILHKPKNKK